MRSNPLPGHEQTKRCQQVLLKRCKVQTLPWQAGENIGKMKGEHSDCSPLSCSECHGHCGPGLVEHGEGVVVYTGRDKVGRIICCRCKRQPRLVDFLLLTKVFFPLEGQDAVGPSLSCKGLTNQHPSALRSAAAWHVKQQLIESSPALLSHQRLHSCCLFSSSLSAPLAASRTLMDTFKGSNKLNFPVNDLF